MVWCLSAISSLFLISTQIFSIYLIAESNESIIADNNLLVVRSVGLKPWKRNTFLGHRSIRCLTVNNGFRFLKRRSWQVKRGCPSNGFIYPLQDEYYKKIKKNYSNLSNLIIPLCNYRATGTSVLVFCIAKADKLARCGCIVKGAKCNHVCELHSD